MERADLEQWRAREVARLLELVETQRRYYQEIVASIPVGLMVLSSDLSIILANAAVRNIFRLSGGDSLRRRLDALFPAWVLDRIEEVLSTGVPQANLMLETEREPRRRLRIAIMAIRNWGEDIAQEALITVEDLTGITAGAILSGAAAPGESALHEMPAPETAIPVSALIDGLDAAVWALKLEDKSFVHVGKNVERLLGFAPEYWKETESFWAERVYAEDRDTVMQAYERAIERQEPYRGEFRARAADGRLVWLREQARVVLDFEGRPELLVGLTLDVTERRLVEEQLVQSERVEAVSRLASRMAHDLNNMLMILTGYGEELLNGLPAGSALRSDVQEVLGAAERMTSLTSQLLAFARRQGPAGQSIALEATLLDMAGRLKAGIADDIALTWTLSLEPHHVKADPSHLEQTLAVFLRHLARNGGLGAGIAIETSSLHLAEDARLSNAPLRPGNYGAITIRSLSGASTSGSKPVLFDWFLPGKDPADDAPALSQAYATVRQWGGDVALWRDDSGVTGFRVLLERVEAPVESPVQDVVTDPPVTEPPAPKLPTVLIVEDEAGIRTLVRKILHRQGYEVLEAASGEEAITVYHQQPAPFDLIVTDMVMPHMSGRELIDQLREQGFAGKVLYVSGYTDDTSVFGTLPEGNAFLQKPFTLGSLLEKVKEVLAAK